MTPLYIFDLDGTLSDNSHRVPLIHPDRKPTADDWTRYTLRCSLDAPRQQVIMTLMSLYERGCDIRIWTGRDELARELTVAWLMCHCVRPRHVVEGWLEHMRENGDNTPGPNLKRKWLNLMSKEDRSRLVAVFEDQQKVVEMWRAEGITCFQLDSAEA
jgi:hypothetical protein|nr:MAG TPA: polynucleotide kinase [Caudoviricetes sp.]